MYASMAKDIIAKSPIKYAVVRNMACLSPYAITTDPSDRNVSRFRRLLSGLCDAKQFCENDADAAIDQYKEVIVSPRSSASLNDFDDIKIVLMYCMCHW